MKIRITKKVITLSVILALVFPLIIVFILSPAIDRVLVNETTGEAYRLADHIIDSFDLPSRPVSHKTVTGEFARDMVLMQKEFNLHKINLFSSENEIVFSTNEGEIGLVLDTGSVVRKLQEGKRYSLRVRKGESSVEGVPIDTDAVEAYVPVMNQSKFMGAIEIYYDISEASAEYGDLKVIFAAALFVVAFILVLFMAVYSQKAHEIELKHQQVQKELIHEQLKSEAIFTAMGDNVIVQDRDYRVIYQNEVNKDIYGDTTGKYCYSVYEGIDHICDNCPIEETYKDGRIHRTEKTVQTPDGRVDFEVTSCPLQDEQGEIIAGIKIVRDITERKNLEEQLRHSQRMEAVGILTSGISHEFNNILAAVQGFAELLRDEMDTSNPLRRYVDVIYQSTERAAELTKGLLVYSRRQATDKQPIMFNEYLRNIREFINRITGVDIRFDLVLSPEDISVLIDANQIQQVLVNLAANARDAMEKGGSFTISTEPFTMDGEFLRLHGFGDPGDYVRISVADSGAGMDRETREKIFEPFFTTKDVGKGTGLGLSVVYGIIKSHSGFIEVDSSPGQGTTFIIYLPVFTVPEEESKQ